MKSSILQTEHLLESMPPSRNSRLSLVWLTFCLPLLRPSLQADLKERYSVNELLADLAGCKATRVLLFVDQSYSGVLSKRLRGSQKHLNVVLIQSQTRQTYNHQRLSPGWEDSSWSYISSATCLLDHLGKVIYHNNVFFFFLSLFD